MKRRLALVLGVSALALAFAAPAFADRLVVDNDLVQCPNADFTSIQAAVNAADAGDRIAVCEGTYAEAVTIATPAKNDLHLRARGDLGDVVLEGGGTLSHGFGLDDVSGIVIEGFWVQHYANDIELEHSDNNVLRRNATTEAFAHDGVELFESDGNVIEDSLSFNNPSAISCGFNLVSSSDNVVRNNEAFGNKNAGILLLNSGPGNVVKHNVTRNNVGGALPIGNGIRNANTPGTLIAHNDVRENGHHGLYVTGAGSTGVEVRHNDVLLNGTLNDDDGIRLDAGAAMNVVAHNTSERNRHDGIHLVGVHQNVVEHNDLIHNGTPGLGNGCGSDVEGGSSNNLLRHNFATGHDRAGIRLRGAGPGNVVSRNDLVENGRVGIRNETTTGTMIERNDVEHSLGFGVELGHGIQLVNATGVTIRRNDTDENTGDGISFQNGDVSTVDRNTSDDNTRDGIRLDSASAGNLLERNRMFGNGEHDAHDDNRPANTWSGNDCDTDFPAGTICGV